MLYLIPKSPLSSPLPHLLTLISSSLSRSYSHIGVFFSTKLLGYLSFGSGSSSSCLTVSFKIFDISGFSFVDLRLKQSSLLLSSIWDRSSSSFVDLRWFYAWIRFLVFFLVLKYWRFCYAFSTISFLLDICGFLYDAFCSLGFCTDLCFVFVFLWGSDVVLCGVLFTFGFSINCSKM